MAWKGAERRLGGAGQHECGAHPGGSFSNFDATVVSHRDGLGQGQPEASGAGRCVAARCPALGEAIWRVRAVPDSRQAYTDSVILVEDVEHDIDVNV